jgi:deazaflavin-dependent oxidoreductase (nitroreductase family)
VSAGNLVMASDAEFARKKMVRLTTRGRKSGAPRTVPIWFVAAGARTILVQHATSAPANWYRNLVADGTVSVDFGDGPIRAHATPITDAARIGDVLAQVRKKYWSAWLIQRLGRRTTPLAAEITW